MSVILKPAEPQLNHNSATQDATIRIHEIELDKREAERQLLHETVSLTSRQALNPLGSREKRLIISGESSN